MPALGSRGPGGRLRSKLAQGRLADDGPSFHAAVVLGRCERVLTPERRELDAAVEARCLGSSDREHVEPEPVPDPSRVQTTVAEREGHDAVRHAGEDPDWKLERASRVIDPDHILARKTEW